MTRRRIDSALRVLHATECAAAGTLNVMIALTRELAQAGTEQMVVYSERLETPPDVEKLFPAGVTLIKLPAARGTHMRFVTHLWRTLRYALDQWHPDIIHLHSSKAGFAGRLALSTMRESVQIIYSPHGLPFLDPERPLRNSLFKALEMLAARTRATSLGCGRSEAELLSALSGDSVSALENPVEDRFFAIERQRQPSPVVVSVGRLSRQKAPERFAFLTRSLREQLPGARCIWVGDGDAHYRTELLDAGCEVTGWIDSNEVVDYLSRASIYVQTSLWEGLPISVIQALAAGLPCVVHDCAGNRDAVSHGVTGFVAQSHADMKTYVVRLLADPVLREQMGAAARAEALRRFGAHAFRERVKQIYGITSAATLSHLPLGAGVAT